GGGWATEGGCGAGESAMLARPYFGEPSMTQSIRSILAAVVVCLCSAWALGQQDFSSESKSWTFTMPAGWQAMSAEQVAKLNKEYKTRAPDHPSRVVAGFVKSGGMFAYPQVVLQVLEADMTK